MTAGDREITLRYEDLSMSVNDIAADLSLSDDVVRLSLAQNSAFYRNTLRAKSPAERDMFNDMIVNRAGRIMEQLLDADGNEEIQFRAARFIIDESKGRNDARVKGLQEVQKLGIGVQELNLALRRARIQRVGDGSGSSPDAIEVKEVTNGNGNSHLLVEQEENDMVLVK